MNSPHSLPRSLLSLARRHLWLYLTTLLALPALAPLYTEGLPRSYDGGYHMLRLAVLDRAVTNGVFLPRWAPDMLLGFGYPAFNFYGPGSYWLAELLHWMGLGLQAAFTLGFVVAVIAAGYGASLLACDIFGVDQPWLALTVAVAYMYAPYVMDNVYIRGGLAETMALAVLPWILFSFRRLFYVTNKRPAFFLATFALALLAITHNITLLFTPPLLLGYLLVHWRCAGYKMSASIWPLAALLAAMGVSAFFWLPLIAERSYLSDQAYTIARQVWLPLSVWTWQNFLDAGFTFSHTFIRPNRLGIVQLVLGVGGFLAARRRDAEWLYLGAVTLIASALIGAWALPLWQSNDILTIAQFPWRLLSIISLPLAIFSSGWLLRLQAGGRPVAAALLITLIIIAQRPQLAWIDVFAPHEPDLSVGVMAQIELEKGVLAGGEGNSSIQEFRPRWVDETLALKEQPPVVTPAPLLAVTRATLLDLEATAQVTVTTPLRFTDFYFPGWQVTIDDVRAATYPSTSLGLLTVDLPPGEHVIRKTWTHTAAQSAGTWLSLITLAMLVGLGWRSRRTRWLAALPALLLAGGLIGWLTPLTFTPIQPPTAPVQRPGVNMLGFQIDTSDAQRPIVRSFWAVTAPLSDLRLLWRVLTPAGEVVGDVTTRPFYNAGSTTLWPAGTIVDDAVVAPVPSGLPAGDYHLAVALVDANTVSAATPTVIGSFTLTTSPVDPIPATTATARFADDIRLTGYDYTGATADNTSPLPYVAAGDYLWVTLHWATEQALAENYHAFVHLVDSSGRPLAQEDHIPGPLFAPPAGWTPGRSYRDAHLLRIPADALGGVYWPTVGMYTYDDQARLSAYADAASKQAGVSADAVRLSPIKVTGKTRRPSPQHSLSARVGDIFEVLGYDISTPDLNVRPGTPVTLTLYYRSLTPTTADLTRFVHLYAPETGMMAQHDGPPTDDLNPTWAWRTGEIIEDRVTLTVNAGAVPGTARLLLGFYDVAAGAERIPTFDAAGALLPDAAIPLAEVEIAP